MSASNETMIDTAAWHVAATRGAAKRQMAGERYVTSPTAQTNTSLEQSSFTITKTHSDAQKIIMRALTANCTGPAPQCASRNTLHGFKVSCRNENSDPSGY